MKNSILLIIGLIFVQAFCQQEQSSLSNELPQIFSPSPTVSSLMRFEEIPVNNYTGIPDISIPLFSTNTKSEDVNINLSLNYHPTSIAADEVASYTGLGWSLMAGGTISRTVRGIPDEYFANLGLTDSPKIGILYDSAGTEDTNYYYKVEELLNGNNTDQYTWDIERFLFESFEKGKFDSQYDLYQYNFMGNSGRFIIKKDRQSNSLKVVKLDDNRHLKINLDYSFATVNGRPQYTINFFTLIDEKGNRYVFDVKEIHLQTTSWSEAEYIGIHIETSPPTTSMNRGYPTAFHLRQVYDKHNNLAVSYAYSTTNETITNSTETWNEPQNYSEQTLISNASGLYYESNRNRLEPKHILNVTINSLETKKLSEIIIEGRAKIYFTLQGNREDRTRNSCFCDGKKLTEILIKDWNNTQMKKFQLFYNYFTVSDFLVCQDENGIGQDLKRMILTEVREYNNDNSDYHHYSLEYKNNGIPHGKSIVKDPWGYMEVKPRHGIGYGILSEKLFVTNGVLEKMHVPTGGYVQFDFEPNTYSYEGDKDILNFDENPENIVINGETEAINFDIRIPSESPNSNINQLIFDNMNSTHHGFEFYVDYSSLGDNWEALDLICELVSSDPNEVIDFKYYQFEGELLRFYVVKAKPGSKYYLNIEYFGSGYWDPNSGPSPHHWDMPMLVHLDKYKNISEAKQYLYGGGLRIRDIKFFENDSPNADPVLETNYNYSIFSNGLKSSGSLAFAKPVFSYQTSKAVDFVKAVNEYSHGHLTLNNLKYQTKTTFNNLSLLRTHGADVGYENVTVKKIDTTNEQNSIGKTQYTYVSPKQVPELSDEEMDAYVISYPFIHTKNLDYKRGLLKKSVTIDSNNRTLMEVVHDYDIIPNPDQLTGVILARSNGGNPFAYIYNRFTEYLNHYNTCDNQCNGNNHYGNCALMEDPPASSITKFGLYEASGWSKLTRTITKEYSYEGSTQKIVETVQDFTYNDVNKQIQTQSVTNSLGEIIKTEYTYPQDGIHWQTDIMNQMVQKNMISTPVIVKTSNNGTPVSEQMTEYQIVNTTQILPQYVYAKKGTAPLEKKITYDRYDSSGNLQQYRLADGTPVSIIWGYNGQYPIARVEGVAYADIETEAAALAANNNLTESSFFTLRGLVTDPSKYAMLTCYIYEPLVGVKMIIQPNGQKEIYEYDSAGRLMKIFDHEGKELKKIDYHYKPQP